jgi:hypothetical protein
MARTHIIAGDGTHFVARGRGKVIARRAIGTAALLITALFLSAAIIGLNRAATAPAPMNIILAQKACAPAPATMQGACIALALRPAYDINNTHTPNGIALVTECLDQYKGQELISCFTQPIN